MIPSNKSIFKVATHNLPNRAAKKQRKRFEEEEDYKVINIAPLLLIKEPPQRIGKTKLREDKLKRLEKLTEAASSAVRTPPLLPFALSSLNIALIKGLLEGSQQALLTGGEMPAKMPRKWITRDAVSKTNKRKRDRANNNNNNNNNEQNPKRKRKRNRKQKREEARKARENGQTESKSEEEEGE